MYPVYLPAIRHSPAAGRLLLPPSPGLQPPSPLLFLCDYEPETSTHRRDSVDTRTETDGLPYLPKGRSGVHRKAQHEVDGLTDCTIQRKTITKDDVDNTTPIYIRSTFIFRFLITRESRR